MVMRKKRLCIIVPAHWTAFMGGSQYQVKLLLEMLIPQDEFEVFYLARKINTSDLPGDHHVIQIAEHKGVRVHGYTFDALRLLRLLNEIKPDVIYQRVACAYTGIAAFYAKKNHCKMIWHIAHEWDVMPGYGFSNSRVISWVERKWIDYGIKNASYIVSQTKDQADLLLKNYGRSVDAIVPNFQPIPSEKIIKETPIKVLWVANFKKMKRPELFVNLSRDLSSLRGVRFIMVGDPGPSGKYKSLLEEIQKIDNLEYLGQVSQEDVNRLLSQSHIFVNTSITEGFPNTFIQAWMREVPVISMDVNPDDVLESNGIGFCANGSYEKLRELLSSMVSNHSERQIMGKKARDYAEHIHTPMGAHALIKLFLG